MTLDAMEVLVIERGRELLRGLVQLALDAQAEREVRLPQVTGTDGVPRARAERGHDRPVVTRLGEVRVRRIGYRSGVRGAGSLFPRDAVLNLPPLGYSWALQRLAEMFCRSGSYEQAHEFVLAATGVSIGKRQLEQIIVAAAADAERFCQDRSRDQAAVPAAGEQEQGLPPLAISADGKGVAMLPEARRRRTRAPEQKVRTFDKRAGTGEKKGCKRMAETGAVFDVAVPDGPARTPEQVMRPERGTRREEAAAGGEPLVRLRHHRRPRRHHRQDLRPRPTAATLITARTWIALVDGDNYQLGLIQAAAAARGITLAIVIDFIHVLEYLWKAAWCFHPPRDPAMEDWVIAQALDILHGRTGEVIARIRPLAAEHPPKPGGEHAKIIRKTLSYLQAKQPFMDYPRALANGWPIATGVIEGACRHLVADRMGITGARWGLDRSPGHALAPRHRRQRRHRRLLGLAHQPRTPAQPPKPLPGQPRTRRLTLTPEEPHRVSRTQRGACRVGNEDSLMRCCTGDGGLMAPRSRPAGGGFKPPHAALAEDRRGER